MRTLAYTPIPIFKERLFKTELTERLVSAVCIVVQEKETKSKKQNQTKLYRGDFLYTYSICFIVSTYESYGKFEERVKRISSNGV